MKKGKKVTLEEVGGMLSFVVEHMATKEDVLSLHMQVNSIETQIRGMHHARLEARVADLEEKVFGKGR